MRGRVGRELVRWAVVFVGALVVSAGTLPAFGATRVFLVHDKSSPRERYASSRRRPASFLYVMSLDDTRKRVTIIHRFPTQHGGSNGPKRHEGDLRTPVGRYRTGEVRRRRESRFAPYSVEIDYPTRHDRRRRNPGGQILIHGGPRRPTAGCIRLPSSEHMGTVARLCDASRRTLLSFSALHSKGTGRPGTELSPEAYVFYRDLLREPIRVGEGDENERVDALGSRGPSSELRAREEKSGDPLKIWRQKRKPRVRARADAALPRSGSIRYDASRAVDGDPKSAWAVRGSSAHWIELQFSHSETLDGFEIYPGYAKTVGASDRWYQNNRVAKMRVRADGHTSTCTLPNRRTRFVIRFEEPLTTRTLRLEILEVHRGTRFDDTCVSEISPIWSSSG